MSRREIAFGLSIHQIECNANRQYEHSDDRDHDSHRISAFSVTGRARNNKCMDIVFRMTYTLHNCMLNTIRGPLTLLGGA